MALTYLFFVKLKSCSLLCLLGCLVLVLERKSIARFAPFLFNCIIQNSIVLFKTHLCFVSNLLLFSIRFDSITRLDSI